MKNKGSHAIVSPMKSPILILFIVFNLLTINMALAINVDDEVADQSYLLQTPDSVDQSSVLTSSIGESSCDHFCHISAHLLGFISCETSLSTIDTSTVVFIQDETFHSLALEPPSQPPRA